MLDATPDEVAEMKQYLEITKQGGVIPDTTPDVTEQWIEAYEKISKERDIAKELAANLREAFQKGFYAAIVDCRECPNSGSF